MCLELEVVAVTGPIDLTGTLRRFFQNQDLYRPSPSGRKRPLHFAQLTQLDWFECLSKAQYPKVLKYFLRPGFSGVAVGMCPGS